jgi:hypothetical protein
MVCGSCADRVKRELPQDSHAAFMRAIMYGLVGFFIGLVLYAGFVIATGISIGYIALAVGWIVGKAMMLGSKGVGGRRYQIVAVLLTYAAVSIAFVPIMIYYVKKDRAEHPKVQQVSANGASTSANAGQDGRAESGQDSSPTTAAETPKQRPSLASLAGTLVLWGLASPFLRLSSNPMAFIGLIILFVGMQFAWKMTAGRPGVQIAGPFELSKSASA